ncbi:MAG: chromosome segregation protein SMC, partial [Candidatus Diapherotrites archaeon]|nr:chromosome segregation protein SMC [Candidatus Diapherotrites archaeon]
MVRLKRLTLKNFKSFRSAVIPFADGFTAIMGPNGSGKSNIIDALIFVLGEGRLKLVRASRLKDLVNVKARDGEALVSLDIDADGKVYTITRTINKRGQSVYRINGKRSTKHEVVSLLSSLGISQRGYNFVLQGEITRLIKMTPLERRKIIDEIAGIAEYEEKKEEALKKLEDVSERIKEVSIVLGEREALLEKLKKEKEDAERYLELKAYVASLRKGLLLREIQRSEQRLKEVLEELERKREKLQELLDVKARLEEEIRALEEKSQELARKISVLYGEGAQGEYDQLLKEKERLEAELRYLRQRRNEIDAELLSISEEMEKLEREMALLEKDVEDIEGRKREKDAEVNELRRQIRSLEEVIRREQEESFALQRRLEEIEAQIARLKEEYASLREEYGRISGEYNAKLEEVKRKRERLERKLKEREEIKKKLEEIEKEIRSLEEERRDLLEAEKRLNREYLLLQEEIKALREEIGALRGAALALRNLGISVEVLNELLEAQRRGELRGIKGFVASLIRYDKKYRRALEAAAGRRLFYIVVETANDAAEAIKYLKRRGLGRATFIPLDKIRPHLVEPPRRPGVIGRALDLVDYDPTVKRAMEYVFGDTVVVENIDIAKELDGYRAVTLDGDVVERSGVMSGGSTKGESVLKLFEAEKKRAELREKELQLKEIVARLSEIRKALERI